MGPDGLQALSLAAAEARSLSQLLHQVVVGLAAEKGVALARIWLLDDGASALKLAASAGASVDGTPWTRLDGDFSVMPLGQRKVGIVASSARMILIADHAQKDPHIARPEWAKHERIRAFCGQPLLFRGQVLGVLAIFSREPIDETSAGWLRTFADHCAVAIANARAFDELHRLRNSLELERDELRAEISSASAPIVGSSAAIVELKKKIELVAATDASVLVVGESGTGKELVATAVHEASPRAKETLVRINCAAVPADLFESEFFGHARGAFTGAVKERAGKLQLAHKGTMFLDEVAEIPLPLQPKLLRAIQEHTFSRVGEDETRTVDVRFISATNRDLRAEVRAGRFREDLYYRLSVFPIELPPLRERPEDIAPLAKRFLDDICRRYGKPRASLRAGDVALLEQAPWRGNVRELMNVVERAMILGEGGRPRFDLALSSTEPAPPTRARTAFVTAKQWRERERDNLRAALNAAGGRVYGAGGAAELLGMKPTTLTSRLQALGVKRG